MNFVRCPKCHAQVWEDLHALINEIPTRFRCIRCDNIISLGKCKSCSKKSWERLSDSYEKESKKPIVRFKCNECQRDIGLILD